MAYINNNKVFSVVKTKEIKYYKHHVKMQGSYGGKDFTIYADLISTDQTNWATQEAYWSDIMIDYWEGVIVGYDNQNNKYQFMRAWGRASQDQASLYYDIENLYNAQTIDASVLVFIEDTVTPFN